MTICMLPNAHAERTPPRLFDHARPCARVCVCLRFRVIRLTVRVGWNDSVTFLSRGLCRADRDSAKRLAGWFLLCALTGIINTHIIKTKIPRKTVRKSWSVPWQFWHVRKYELYVFFVPPFCCFWGCQTDFIHLQVRYPSLFAVVLFFKQCLLFVFKADWCVLIKLCWKDSHRANVLVELRFEAFKFVFSFLKTKKELCCYVSLWKVSC